MNKSAERAEALARAEKLVREANSRKTNLEGIADLLQCNLIPKRSPTIYWRYILKSSIL